MWLRERRFPPQSKSRPRRARRRTHEQAGRGHVKDFIKQYWAETGGSPTRLLQKAQELGRPTTLAGIAGAKSSLIRKDGWIPPDGNGAARRDALPAVRRTGPVPKAAPAGDSAAELMRRGIAQIGEGLQLVTQALTMTEGMESRLKVLEPLYAAFQQAVAADVLGTR